MIKKDIIISSDNDYELIDSGLEEKLERFGNFVLRRPDPQALWHKHLPLSHWEKADAYFETNHTKGTWKSMVSQGVWNMNVAGITFELSHSTFKHIGIFPEQIENWKWLQEQIKTAERPIKALNLFGYTGGATISALLAGAEVTHVDGSKTAISQAVRNAELSGVKDKSVRWIPDDVQKFVEREIRRGMKYDVIVMDPPAFGHGAKKEVWKIEEHLLPLLTSVSKILSDTPLCVIVNGYASGYSSYMYAQNLTFLTEKYGGEISHGELLISEKGTERFLPAGISARWSL